MLNRNTLRRTGSRRRTGEEEGGTNSNKGGEEMREEEEAAEGKSGLGTAGQTQGGSEGEGEGACCQDR